MLSEISGEFQHSRRLSLACSRSDHRAPVLAATATLAVMVTFTTIATAIVIAMLVLAQKASQ